MADRDEGPGSGVLRRLLTARDQSAAGAEKAPHLPQPVPPTPARAAATAIGRAADRLYHLAVQPVAVTPGALTLAELPELLPSPALLVVLQGPGDLVGTIALCPETVTALIEIQALGRVTARPVERRRPTRSDAMICADFVNALMAELASEMAGIDGFDGIKGYRYATYLDDPRPLALMLEDKPYRSLAFDLRLGGTETRDSRIFLALPQPAAQERAPAGRDDSPTRATPTEGRSAGPVVAGAAPPVAAPSRRPASASLASSVQLAPVDLVGVLFRRRMTLGELRGLAAGRLLHMPRASLTEARLETPSGQLLAIGRFGEAEGCHALRLRDPLAVLTPAPAASEAVDAGAARPAGTTAPGAAPEPPIEDLSEPDAFRQNDADRGSVAPGSVATATQGAAKAAGGA
ncbi:FliM/FliN family flagellar motor switch protein [Paracoccus marinaquae]|uniref:FliM/FliN family flagellar motor C-terminal domain-containing protein n=1 Tax=Paracoccus marinaquae TaxID=2841926 RepID=A0ABS6AFF4_9RHOB|nr:FliM/FliN family flagellar motor switch protein [Paracoccus marinaquae]MBU3028946.1 FliM/FliN family flagellar motor C-terminal domain-containing protein [Paracoccus marinaquae]